MDRKVIKNYLYNTSYQLLLIVLPLITTPYVSRTIGAEGIGTYNYTNSITQYFILFGCIGLNLYGQREIAYYQNNIKKRNNTFFELIILRFFTIVISLVVFYFTCIKISSYSTLFLIQTMDIIASVFDISWFFQGLEEFKKIVTRNFFVKTICVILIFTFVKSPDDLYLYVLSYSLTLLLGNISLWFYLPKYLRHVEFENINIFRHIKPAVTLFIPQIATSLYTILDKTMIGALSNNSEVAFYTQAQVLIKTFLALLTSLGTVMLPRVSNLFKEKQFKEIKKSLMQSFNFVFFLAFPMTFGLMALSFNIVGWFFGPGFERVIPNLIIIAPIIIFIGLSNIMGTQYLLPVGKQKAYTLSVSTGMIVNVIFNVLLIPVFASIGAAFATVIAEMCVAIVQYYFIRNDFSFAKILADNYKYIVCSIVMFIPACILSVLFRSTIINSLIVVFIGIITYFGLLIIFKDKMVINFFDKIKSFI